MLKKRLVFLIFENFNIDIKKVDITGLEINNIYLKINISLYVKKTNLN